MDCVWDTGRIAGEGERFGGDIYRWKRARQIKHADSIVCRQGG